MEKRHDDIINARLETVLTAGVAHVLWSELYLWYDVQKIAARTVRDLIERWEELSRGEHGRLMQISGSGGIFLVAERNINPVVDPKA